jgi:hypothetical protein
MKAVDRPCLVTTQAAQDDPLDVSEANPDLNLQPARLVDSAAAHV